MDNDIEVEFADLEALAEEEENDRALMVDEPKLANYRWTIPTDTLQVMALKLIIEKSGKDLAGKAVLWAWAWGVDGPFLTAIVTDGEA